MLPYIPYIHIVLYCYSSKRFSWQDLKNRKILWIEIHIAYRLAVKKCQDLTSKVNFQYQKPSNWKAENWHLTTFTLLSNHIPYSREYYSMTTLLTHTVAHSTKPSFRTKTNNQPLKKFLSLALGWTKVVKNWTSF